MMLMTSTHFARGSSVASSPAEIVSQSTLSYIMKLKKRNTSPLFPVKDCVGVITIHISSDKKG